MTAIEPSKSIYLCKKNFLRESYDIYWDLLGNFKDSKKIFAIVKRILALWEMQTAFFLSYNLMLSSCFYI